MSPGEKKIEIEVVTPERLAFKDDVNFIVLPGLEGEIGILPGHAPLLAQLSTGELRITKGAETEHFAVSGGFAEVRSGRAKVFAETAEIGKEISVERARLALERAKKEISAAATPQDLELAQAALRRALLRLHVSEGLSRRNRK